VSDDILEKTRRFWSERTGRAVSTEEAREAVANVVGFCQLLNEWDQHATEITDSHATCSAVGRGGGQTTTANRTCSN